MSSERVSKNPPVIAVQLRRTFWQRLADAYFGYDFFISYAHADGKLYADGMARLWDISVDEAVPLKKRILEYEVQSATRLDTDGEVKALTPEEWIEAKRLLAQAKTVSWPCLSPRINLAP